MRLKTKLILFVLGVIIVPLIVSGLIGYYLHLRREWIPSPSNIQRILRDFERAGLSMEGGTGGLIGATRKVAEGDLDFEVQAKGNDEIASLIRSFDSMRKNLKESIARRSRFLMGVSHDLKTPLTSIKGHLEAISDGLADDPEKLTRYLSVIGDKSKALEERIAKLIDYVKMETGDWRMSQEEIDLAGFFSEIAGMYSEDASVFKRSFVSDLRIPPGARTTADRALVLRCFENLFDNAVRYGGEGDTITLSAHLKDGEILVTFQNTGSGIETQELHRVFEPFYRGTRSRREEGSGLGLSIVKSIVDAHGWKIDIESTPGEMTALTIRISPVKMA